MRSTALLLVFVSSCTVAQAKKAHTAGAVTLASGLFGILGCVAVAEAVPSISSETMKTGIVFVPISVIGALLYATTDSTVQEAEAEAEHERAQQVTAHDRAYTAAYELARQAKHAARRGDCSEVQAIGPRVRDLDEVVYRKFLHDDIIKTCLEPPASEP